MKFIKDWGTLIAVILALLGGVYKFAIVKEKVDRLEKAEGISTATAFPKGTILGFNLATCPDGWKVFEPAKGRFLVGVGSNEGLNTRLLLETGGEEMHLLTGAEMPLHKHDTVESGDSGNSQWGVGGPRNGRHGVKWQNPFHTSFTGPAGGNKPHNNMPPYVGVLFCEKE